MHCGTNETIYVHMFLYNPICNSCNPLQRRQAQQRMNTAFVRGSSRLAKGDSYETETWFQ
jgi:hypothetical protein